MDKEHSFLSLKLSELLVRRLNLNLKFYSTSAEGL